MSDPLFYFLVLAVPSLVLAAHALATPKLGPLFGSEPLARVVWVVALLLLNPLVWVVYLAVAVRRWSAGLPLVRPVAGVVTLLGALVLELGGGGVADTDPTREPGGFSLSLSASTFHHAALCGFSDHAADHVPMLGRVLVRHQAVGLAQDLAGHLAGLLAERQDVERVDVEPFDAVSIDGERAADFVLEVRVPELSGLAVPGWQSSWGKVVVSGGAAGGLLMLGSIPAVAATGPRPDGLGIAAPQFNLLIEFDESRGGIQWGRARSRDSAWHLAQYVARTATRPPLSGTDWTDDVRPASGLPDLDSLCAYEPPAGLQFLAGLEAELVRAECAPLVPTRCAWRVPAGPDTFRNVRDRLVADGWRISEVQDLWHTPWRVATIAKRTDELVVLSRGDDDPAPFTGLPRVSAAHAENPHASLSETTGRYLHIAYQRTADEATRRAAAARFCRPDAPPGAWAAFADLLDPPDPVLLRQQLLASGEPALAAWWRLADLESDEADGLSTPTPAKVVARDLERIFGCPPRNRFGSSNDDRFELATPSETLRQLGLVVADFGETAELELGPTGDAVLVVRAPDGAWRSLTLRRADDALAVRCRSPGGSASHFIDFADGASTGRAARITGRSFAASCESVGMSHDAPARIDLEMRDGCRCELVCVPLESGALDVSVTLRR